MKLAVEVRTHMKVCNELHAKKTLHVILMPVGYTNFCWSHCIKVSTEVYKKKAYVCRLHLSLEVMLKTVIFDTK